jgi:hypothetical protein
MSKRSQHVWYAVLAGLVVAGAAAWFVWRAGPGRHLETASRVPPASAEAAPPIVTVDVCAMQSAQAPGLRHAGQWAWHVIAPASAHADDGNGWGKVGRVAHSKGDPHLRTLQGLRYSFQGVGEFVALKAPSLQVQVRYRPFGASRAVSLATAVAVDVGGDVVAVYAGRAPTVRLNHQVIAIPGESSRLPRGAELRRQGNGMVVLWPGRAAVRILFGSYLDVVVTLCRSGRVDGLMGGDPDVPDGVAARTGEVVQLSGLTGEALRRRLYQVLGDGWRIAQQDSLFDYAPGETTLTFTDRDFPDDLDPLASVSDARWQQAESACRRAGHVGAGALNECILDVAVTGDPAFATNNAMTELISAMARQAPEALPKVRCRREGGASSAWTCQVANLTAARIGTDAQLDIETRRGGQVGVESVICGAISEQLEARCSEPEGAHVHGARAVLRFVAGSGERVELSTRAECRTVRPAGEAC